MAKSYNGLEWDSNNPVRHDFPIFNKLAATPEGGASDRNSQPVAAPPASLSMSRSWGLLLFTGYLIGKGGYSWKNAGHCAVSLPNADLADALTEAIGSKVVII